MLSWVCCSVPLTWKHTRESSCKEVVVSISEVLTSILQFFSMQKPSWSWFLLSKKTRKLNRLPPLGTVSDLASTWWSTELSCKFRRIQSWYRVMKSVQNTLLQRDQTSQWVKKEFTWCWRRITSPPNHSTLSWLELWSLHWCVSDCGQCGWRKVSGTSVSICLSSWLSLLL